MTRVFRRDMNALGDVFNYLREFSGENHLGESVTYVLNLAVEELFTNMVKYEPDGDPEIPITIERETDRVVVRMVDGGAEPFDVTRAQGRDLDRPAMERRPGGLGLHLVRQMVDEIEYHFKDGRSTITIIKILEP